MNKDIVMTVTARITSKGQVTIPKKIRDILNSRVVEFVVENDRIEVRAVSSVAAGLKQYAKSYVPLSEVREAVWGNHGR